MGKVGKMRESVVPFQCEELFSYIKKKNTACGGMLERHLQRRYNGEERKVTEKNIIERNEESEMGV